VLQILHVRRNASKIRVESAVLVATECLVKVINIECAGGIVVCRRHVVTLVKKWRCLRLSMLPQPIEFTVEDLLQGRIITFCATVLHAIRLLVAMVVVRLLSSSGVSFTIVSDRGVFLSISIVVYISISISDGFLLVLTIKER
jgi:hypothetical protein